MSEIVKNIQTGVHIIFKRNYQDIIKEVNMK
jgi:hypothetical protein